MKILIIRPMANEINIDSYNCQEIGMAKGFIDNGVNCDVLFYSQSNSEKYIIYNGSKITIYYRKAKKLFGIHGIFEDIDSLIARYDFLQLNEVTQIQNLIFLRRYHNKVYFYHGPYKNKYDSKKHKAFDFVLNRYINFINDKYKQSVHVFTKSTLAADYTNKLGFNSTVIGVGLDTLKLATPMLNSVNNKKLLYIGKLEERRNILFLINVISKLVTIDGDYHLTIIGSGSEKYTKKVINEIVDKHLDNYISIIPKVEQTSIHRFYDTSQIFLLPTKYEIFGMVMLESLYFGVPVITTLNGGSSVLNKGIYICNFEISEWVDTILKISNEKTINREQLHRYIESDYEWKKIVRPILSALSTKNR